MNHLKEIELSFENERNGIPPYAALFDYIKNGRNFYKYDYNELEVLSRYFDALSTQAKKEMGQ